MLIKSMDMTFHAIKSNRLYVRSVALNKRHRRDNTIAMAVVYAELVGGRISSIAINAVSHDCLVFFSRLVMCYACARNGRCCHSVLLKNSHPCVEGAMHHDCPVCFEYLFESRNDVTVMPCGHTIHQSCLKEMQEHCQYACPLCSKSVCDMSKVWEIFDMEIAATPMPEPYQNKMIWILCNDCGTTSEVQFHVVAQKCPDCKSYNTRQTR
ncbi:CHY-type/CTCHY-type/RING-type zinc finger protein [Actinidia rufa]|uniref:CHY-type/CTCHY-type/RING-type zinc finger protein n=1 Tax=Actinidia rufa TaxID=165716 RepID=A0A7J0EQZ3_9ERIC|nr:CHY-type/CTCHY-type/RING-type zinc finger protein [Actinidia rufa]